MALESSGTILYVAKISYKSENCFGNCLGEPKFCTDTHTQTYTFYKSGFSAKKMRNKTKNVVSLSSTPDVLQICLAEPVEVHVGEGEGTTHMPRTTFHLDLGDGERFQHWYLVLGVPLHQSGYRHPPMFPSAAVQVRVTSRARHHVWSCNTTLHYYCYYYYCYCYYYYYYYYHYYYDYYYCYYYYYYYYY